jgi:formylglycine-generating enzyme required for sulfatase activity
MPPDRRLRAACALAFLHPGKHWEKWSDEVVDELVKKDLPTAQKWSRLPMEGVSMTLAASLQRVFLDPNRPESERAHAAVLTRYSFLTYSIADADKLMDLVLEIEGEPYSVLNEWFVTIGPGAAKLIHLELDESHPAKAPRTRLPAKRKADKSEVGAAAVDDLARRQAHAAVVLLELENWDKRRGPLDQSERILADRLWPLLRDSSDPRLHSLRSYLIRRFARVGVKADVILDRYAAERDTSARRALLLSLSEYKDHQLPPPTSLKPRFERLLQEYHDDPDAGVHSALDGLLRQWKHQPSVEKIDLKLATGKVEGNRRWYVTSRHAHTLAVIPGAEGFTMGSPDDEPHRRPVEKQHVRRLPRSFAIATKEVTVKQFRAFLKETPDVNGWGPAERKRLDLEPDESPIVGVSWFAAAQYCRWLSEQEGIAEDQRCYPAISKIKDGMPLPADYLTRTGYRLPTEAEWEYACRAGAVTSRPYGSADALLDQYAWHERNAQSRARPVGSLKPNDFGLFDMLGNAWEWCDDEFAPYPPAPSPAQPGAVSAERQRVLRGGGYFCAAPELRSAHRSECHPQISFGQAGFRVARTCR